MKRFRLFALALLIAASLGMASNGYAQSISPQIVAAGSSGAFTSMVIAMTETDTLVYSDAKAVCGTNVWTYADAKKVYAVDPASLTTPVEPGTIAIAWDNDTMPTRVCAYLSVDSVVGNRLLYRQTGSGGAGTNATIFLDGSLTTLAGQSKVSFVKDTATSGLPSAILSSVNGANVNVAFSDIRGEDAAYAMSRARCTPADQVKCFGMGGADNNGIAILSAFNTNSVANTVNYGFSGQADPFHPLLTVPASTQIEIGAYPVMFIYNITDTAHSGGLGSLLPTDVLSHTMSGFLTGRFQGTAELVATPAAAANAQIVDMIIREPLSGTYNTTEFQVAADRDANIGNSQETGFGANTGLTATNCFTVPGSPSYARPAGPACANPAFVPGPGNGGAGYNRRIRAIGGGEMVSAINSTNGSNRLGYNFFSLGTFGGKTNVRYLKLDGIDPLYPSTPGGLTQGQFPTCSGFVNLGTFSCPAGQNPTFDNLIAGDYRAYQIIRAIRYNPAPATVPNIDGLILVSQDAIHSLASGFPHDFAPAAFCSASPGNGTCTTSNSLLPIFRVHYPLSGVTISNNGNSYGSTSEGAEAGGDMGGAILRVITDTTYFNITGDYVHDYYQ